jgi:hypothetical protein
MRAMKNLINTNRGERITSSTIGCGLKRLLFEPFDPVHNRPHSLRDYDDYHELGATRQSLTSRRPTPRESDAYLIYVTFAMVNAPSQTLQFSTVLKRVR